MMLDLQEALTELFSQPSLWDDPAFITDCERRREAKLKSMRAWAARPENRDRPSKKDAQRRYVERHPDRVKASQQRFAKVRWQQTRSNPEKLRLKREYQAKWARDRRTK